MPRPYANRSTGPFPDDGADSAASLAAQSPSSSLFPTPKLAPSKSPVGVVGTADAVLLLRGIPATITSGALKGNGAECALLPDAGAASGGTSLYPPPDDAPSPFGVSLYGLLPPAALPLTRIRGVPIRCATASANSILTSYSAMPRGKPAPASVSCVDTTPYLNLQQES